jgi:hypothetical protein
MGHDVMFRDPRTVAALSATFTRHAMTHFQSPDVMRFRARKAPGHFTGELVTSFKDRVPGRRVKYWCNGNSIKMYEKGDSSLARGDHDRQPGRLQSPATPTRPAQEQARLAADAQGSRRFAPPRRSVARANDTYLDALSTVGDYTPMSQFFDQISRHTTYHHRCVRALRIGHPTTSLSSKPSPAVNSPPQAFAIATSGATSTPTNAPANTAEASGLSAKVGRQVRLLRAHGLIRKISKSHAIPCTAKGHLLTAALSAARQAIVKQLLAQEA